MLRNSLLAGDFGEIEDSMQLIGKLHDRILSILASRSNLSSTQIKRAWKRKNWWLNAEECLTAGFVDQVR